MADPFLFDTSAFITLMDREPGVERVRELLRGAKRGELELHACFVSLTEIQYILTYDQGPAKALAILRAVQKFSIRWLHSDTALCASAAELKSNHRLSLADAFIAAAAIRLGASLLHKDPEFTPLAGFVRQEMLPPKRSVRPEKNS